GAGDTGSLVSADARLAGNAVMQPMERNQMIQFRLTRPQQLAPMEIAAWDELQRGHAAFESPYFRPEFTQAVAAVRDDVEVAVIDQDGRVAGFFPFQRSSLNLGKPVAGKLNDFHGLLV